MGPLVVLLLITRGVWSMTDEANEILQNLAGKVAQKKASMVVQCPGRRSLVFNLEKHIGGGSMAFVFKAKDKARYSDDAVALKVIPFDELGDLGAREEIKRMRVAGRMTVSDCAWVYSSRLVKFSVIIMELMAGDLVHLLNGVEEFAVTCFEEEEEEEEPDQENGAVAYVRTLWEKYCPKVRSEDLDKFVLELVGVLWEEHEKLNLLLVQGELSVYLDFKPENVFIRKNRDLTYWLKMSPKRWTAELRAELVIGDLGAGMKYGKTEITLEYCPVSLLNNPPKEGSEAKYAREVFANVILLAVIPLFLPNCNDFVSRLFDLKNLCYRSLSDQCTALRRRQEDIRQCYSGSFEKVSRPDLQLIIKGAEEILHKVKTHIK